MLQYSTYQISPRSAKNVELNIFPRLHDMRHSFAVGALLRWYENGEDVQVALPRLAMYMGHISIASTAYYLRLMPAVMQKASERFDRSFGHLVDRKAS
jgi:integrase/recombinase XerD